MTKDENCKNPFKRRKAENNLPIIETRDTIAKKTPNKPKTPW